MIKKTLSITLSIIILCSISFSFLSCSLSSSPENSVLLSSPTITQKNWYITIENTPIESISLSDNHIFASTDYGLVHCYPLDNNATAEEIISINSERCLNHKVNAGTDKERIPMNRYDVIENDSIHSYSLYTDKSLKNVKVQEGKSISLKSYPAFAADTMKYHFNIDTSSCTSALIKYGDLLFINKDQKITDYSLPNYIQKSDLVGSTVYYLSTMVNNPNSHYFKALNMQTKKYTWDYLPYEEFPSFQPIFDSTFTKTPESIFLFFKKRNLHDATEVLICEMDYSGTLKSSNIVTSESIDEPATSDITVLISDNHQFIIGELFQTGTVQCIQAEDYSLVWEYILPEQQTILDSSYDSVRNQIALLLNDGSINIISLETGSLEYSAPIFAQGEVPLVFSRGSLQQYNQVFTGFLNNSHSTPFRSMIFIHSRNQNETP